MEFTEQSMRSIGDLNKALDIFTKVGYGQKAIVKLYQQAHEIVLNASVSYSVLPFKKTTAEERTALFEKLPLTFKTAITIEQVEKFKKIYDDVAKVAEVEGLPIREAYDLIKGKELKERTTDAIKANAVKAEAINQERAI